MQALFKIIGTLLLLLVNINANSQSWTHFYNINKTNDIFDNGQEVWVGTDAGLFVVDKTTLQVQHYHTQNSGLPSNDIEAITMDNNSTMWIGTYDDVFAYQQGGQFYGIARPDSLSGLSTEGMLTYCMQVDSSNNIWIGTNMGLLKYDGSQFSHYPISPTYFGNVYNFEIADNQNFYSSGSSFYHFDGNGTWTNIGYAGHYYSNIHQQNDSTVWLFEFFGSILKYNTNTQTVDSTYYNPSNFAPDHTNQDINGNIYIPSGSTNTLSYWDGLSWTNTDTTILKDVIGSANYVYIDNNNTVWAVAGSTLFKIENGVTTSTNLLTSAFPKNSTISANKSGNLYAFSIAEHQLGKIDITGSFNSIPLPYANSGMSTGGLAHIINGDFFIPRYNAIHQYTGSNWVSHSNQGIYKLKGHNILWAAGTVELLSFQNGTWTPYYDFSLPGSPNLGVTAVDTNDLFWAGCYHNNEYKLLSFDGNSTVLYDSINSDFSGQEINGLYVDDNNDLWIMLDASVQHFDGTTWTTYSPPNLNPFGNNLITTVIFKNNNLYVGTRDYGLYIMQNLSTWQQLTKANSELSANRIENLVMDKNNDLWIQSMSVGGFSGGSGRYIDVYHQTVTNTKELENIEEQLGLRIVPNPSTDYIRVQTPKAFDYPIQAKILNSLGQVVHQQKLNTSADFILIKDLSPSTYFIQIQNDHKQYTQQFIKQ